MTNEKKQEQTKEKKIKIEIKGLDIDKAEYQEIVLSHSNNPDRYFNGQNY
ncbi:MAG: hypothetical protein WCK67_01170 [bacterium]